MKKVIIYILTLFTFSCNNGDKVIQEIEKVYESGKNIYDELIRLDSIYKDNFYVTTELAYFYMLTDKLELAESSFLKAEKKIKRKNLEWTYKFYSGYADLKLSQNQWEEAFKYSKIALDTEYEDVGAIIITAARSALKMKKFEVSYSLYKDALETHDRFFTYSDWNNCSDLSMLYEDFNYTRDLWHKYWLKNGYDPGLGIRISALSAKLNEASEAFIASYLDLDYQKSLNLLKNNETSTYIEESRNMKVNQTLVEGISLFNNGQWSEAAKELENSSYESIIFDFFLLSCRIESFTATVHDIQEFVNLEPYFYNHPDYFHRLIKSGFEHPKYSSLELMEKGITYSNKAVSQYYKKELGFKLGLTEDESKHILVEDEIKRYIRVYNQGKDLNALAPIIYFLNISEIYTTPFAIEYLKPLVKEPVVKKYLEVIRDKATGVLKLRLEMII